MRRDRHIYYMDVQEIKELVMSTASRRGQAEQVLQEALSEEPDGRTDMPHLIIGSIPIFWKNFLVDLRDQKILTAMRFFDLYAERYGNCVFSFKGLEHHADHLEAVAQLRRSGLVRYSQQIPGRKLDSGIPAFFPTAIDLLLRKFIVKASDVYRVADVSGPFLLGMMIKTKSSVTGLYPDSMLPQVPVSRGTIMPGQHAFPIMEAYDFGDLDSIMRPLCDQVHQGFGEAASPKFDTDGKWLEGA
jgi:hypothetical protein